MAHTAPQGVWHEENWASQLLREKGHKVGRPESGGTRRFADMRRPVDDQYMTSEEIINKASQYPEWKSRKRVFLGYLNAHQDVLRTNAP